MSDQNDKLDELGRSVTRAVRFLGEVYRDVGQLLVELDGLMTAAGAWRATEKGRVSYGLSNAMNPAGWVAECLFRFYVPSGTGGTFRSLIGFIVRCDPPDGFDQPVLLGFAARFDLPTDWLSVYQQWTSSDPAITGLATVAGPRPLSAKEATLLVPGATSVTGLAVPLCRMTGSDNLRLSVVEPLLAILATPPT